VITIDLGARCRVTIPAGFDMDAAARLLNGLVVRP
jgi:transposase